MTLTPARARDADGHPVWSVREGQPLVQGVAAWRRLAVGLRCETWLGWSLDGWHPAIVKLPRPHQVLHPRAWAALTREVYVLTRAHHPGLPRLYAARTDADLPHVVLEHVDGPTLADELDDGGPLDPESALQLTAQLLTAVRAVHATGAAHVDVKPDNVLLRDGRPVLIDFGSARPLGSAQPPGRPLGTLGYAAPEMEACRPISAAMDVYGVGMVLGECLDLEPAARLRVVDPGRSPLDGPRSPRDRLVALAGRLTEPDPRVRPGVPEALEELARIAGAGTLWPGWLHGPTAPADPAPVRPRRRASA